ncbi:MAG: ABC transporter permease [Gammaproteobacteria bacterium]
MSVLRLIGQRLLASLLTLLLVSIIVFAAVEILPGDVATRVLGRDATPETLALFRSRMHLDDPPVQRYALWLGGVVRGDFGTALTSSRPVGEILAARIGNTVRLAALAFALYLPLTLIPALIQALQRDRAEDHVLSVLSLVALSIPDFLLATLMLIGFAVILPWFPAMSIVDASTSGAEFFAAIVLPATTLAIVMAVYAVRMLRDNLIEILEADFIRMAELKGLSRTRVLLRHALPNAIVPTLNVTALNLAYLIGGVVIVEKVFAFPGFGSLTVEALQLRDAPLIEATVLIAAGVYILANLVADVAAIVLNPRLRSA